MLGKELCSAFTPGRILYFFRGKASACLWSRGSLMLTNTGWQWSCSAEQGGDCGGQSPVQGTCRVILETHHPPNGRTACIRASGAAVTSDRELDILKQQTFVLSQHRRPGVWARDMGTEGGDRWEGGGLVRPWSSALLSLDLNLPSC